MGSPIRREREWKTALFMLVVGAVCGVGFPATSNSLFTVAPYWFQRFKFDVGVVLGAASAVAGLLLAILFIVRGTLSANCPSCGKSLYVPVGAGDFSCVGCDRNLTCEGNEVVEKT